MTAHHLTNVTVVADAGMISADNKAAIEAAGLSFILGEKIPTIPYVISKWHNDNPGREIPDGLVLTQPWPGEQTITAADPIPDDLNEALQAISNLRTN